MNAHPAPHTGRKAGEICASTGKVRYRNRHEARVARAGRFDAKGLSIYTCRECGSLHLGHSSFRQRRMQPYRRQQVRP